MKTKYTPGPWSAKTNKWDEGELLVQAGPPTNRVLARFGSVDEPLDEIDKANAQLISASPLLLEAVRKLCNASPSYAEMVDDGWDESAIREMSEAYDLGRSAIAKAQGEPHE